MSKYLVFPSKSVPGEWYAEPIVDRGTEPYGALFYGPDSRERAEEYAAWKNENGHRLTHGEQQKSTG